jgi:lipopolysaccharide transport system ATP-binding protein
MLRGLYRGLSDSGMRGAWRRRYRQFSGLGEFFDVPIRTYSAGMGVRLAFALRHRHGAAGAADG